MTPADGPACNSDTPCTWRPAPSCEDCQISGRLMCRFDRKDMVHFFMMILPFGVTAIAGTIRAGYGPYLVLWLAYALFFFFIWEARVLCRHCPYWAEAGRTLHCHANYGVIKLWRYQPRPMSRWEKLQFLIGAAVLMGFPFPFLLLGHQYLLFAIGLAAVGSDVFILRRNVCTRCVNFSCPLNAVAVEIVDAYLKRNPAMHAAWESVGYHPRSRVD